MAATLDGEPIGRRQLLRTLGLTAGVTAVGGACSLDFGDPERPNSLWIRQATEPPGRPTIGHIARSAGSSTIVAEKSEAMFPGAAAPFAYSHLELTTPDVARAREFYQNTLAMHLAYDDPGDSATGVGPQSYLRFGENPSCSDRAQFDGRPPYVDRIGFAIHDFDRESVATRLRDRGLDPKPFTRLGWTIAGPDGLRVDIVRAAGLPEHLGRECGAIRIGAPRSRGA